MDALLDCRVKPGNDDGCLALLPPNDPVDFRQIVRGTRELTKGA